MRETVKALGFGEDGAESGGDDAGSGGAATGS